MRKKSGPPERHLTKASEVEDLQKSSEIYLVCLGKNEDILKAFKIIAYKNDDLPFAILENAEIAKKFDAKQRSVVLLKKLVTKRNGLEKVRELSDFIAKYSMKKSVPSMTKKILVISLLNGKTVIIDYIRKVKESQKKIMEIFL